jgi:protein-S-isoprenylcysteine O-methyltransferase Ste14
MPGAVPAGAVLDCWVGSVLMLLLFVFVSIPLMEKRQLARRGLSYASYMDEVSMLVPFVL